VSILWSVALASVREPHGHSADEQTRSVRRECTEEHVKLHCHVLNGGKAVRLVRSFIFIIYSAGLLLEASE